MPESISEDCLKLLEHFVVLLYNRTSPDDEVNQARKHLFTQKGHAIKNIPTINAALEQHAKRAFTRQAIVGGNA